MRLCLHGSKMYLGALASQLSEILLSLHASQSEPVVPHVAHRIAAEIAVDAGLIPIMYLRHENSFKEILADKVLAKLNLRTIDAWGQAVASRYGEPKNPLATWTEARGIACGKMVADTDVFLLLPGNHGTVTLLSMAERANVYAAKMGSEAKVKPIALYGWPQARIQAMMAIFPGNDPATPMRALFPGMEGHEWLRVFDDKPESIAPLVEFLTKPTANAQPTT